jgi:hypothetical protein
MITGRELIKALEALPESMLDMPVFSTCDWAFVSGVDPEPQHHGHDYVACVEIL